MDFRKRDRVVEGCNWLMVGVAAGWVVYTFASSFSSPADSQTSILPAVIVQPAPLHTEVAPVPVWGGEDNTANNPSDPSIDRASRPSRASAASRSDRTPRAPSAPQERDPTAVWGDAPYVPGPSLQTLPPGVGPDF